MQTPLWLAAILILTPSAQAAFLEGSAGSPAQMRGDIEGSALSWMLLVVAPTDELQVHFQAANVERLVNHTSLWTQRYDNPVYGGGEENELAHIEQRSSGPANITLTLGAGRWSSLLIEGHDLHLQVQSEGEVLSTGSDTKPLSDAYNVGRGIYRPFLVAERSLLLRLADLPANPFQVAFNGASVTRMEWHNATVSCPSGVSCPDGARTAQFSAPGLLVQSLAYLDATVSDGVIEGAGWVYAVAAGGPAMALSLEGVLRLPDVSLNRCEPSPCPTLTGQTLTLQGPMKHAQLGFHTQDRMRFTMETHAAAFADEAPIPSLVLATAPVVGAVALALALKLGLALAARPIKDPLVHPARKAIYSLILAEPGISFREILDMTGIGNGSLVHHLRVLGKAELVADHSVGKRRFLFENHGRYTRTWQAVAALRDEPTRLLFDWLRSQPNAVNQKDVLSFSVANGWSRSATQKRLNRLTAQALVGAIRHGRSILYLAVPAAVDFP